MIDFNKIKKPLEIELENLGYVLFSLKYFNTKNGYVLEIMVDRDDDIGIDDIVEVSNKLSNLLDELILDSTPYTLDVSSVGAEKPIDLNKIEKYVGKYINIHLSHPYKGLNTLEGDFVSFNDKEITIEYRQKTRKIQAIIEKENIDKARLAIKF